MNAKKLLTAKAIKKINKFQQDELLALVISLSNAIEDIDKHSKQHYKCGCCGEANWSGNRPRHLDICQIVKARKIIEEI